MSDDAVSDNTPNSRGTTLEEGARVRVVRCNTHQDCGFVGEVGTVIQVEVPTVGERSEWVRSAWVRFGHSRETWYFAIADLEAVR